MGLIDTDALTIDELKTMHGEPVWCETLGCWGIVVVEDSGRWAGIPFLLGHHGCRFEYNIEIRSLVLYRTKPELLESLRPHGRCRYCSKDDGSGFQWDFDDIEVSVYLQGGVLTISNQYGEEAEMPINYCPYCGAKMKGAGD